MWCKCKCIFSMDCMLTETVHVNKVSEMDIYRWTNNKQAVPPHSQTCLWPWPCTWLWTACSGSLHCSKAGSEDLCSQTPLHCAKHTQTHRERVITFINTRIRVYAMVCDTYSSPYSWWLYSGWNVVLSSSISSGNRTTSDKKLIWSTLYNVRHFFLFKWWLMIYLISDI